MTTTAANIENQQSLSADTPPASKKSVVGLLLFIATEIMFFGGLISIFLILRASAEVWPPLGQPYLPVGSTAINTLILLGSGFTMWRAVNSENSKMWLLLTGLFGLIFLVIQGKEWLSLIAFGMTLSSGTYGGTFYTLIGFHALHVFGGLVYLLVVTKRVFSGTTRFENLLETCSIFWYFVVALWPVLYFLVYLKRLYKPLYIILATALLLGIMQHGFIQSFHTASLLLILATFLKIIRRLFERLKYPQAVTTRT